MTHLDSHTIHILHMDFCPIWTGKNSLGGKPKAERDILLLGRDYKVESKSITILSSFIQTIVQGDSIFAVGDYISTRGSSSGCPFTSQVDHWNYC